MARTPAQKREAIYETTVYNYGKRYYVTGKYSSAEEARKDAPRHFRGKCTTRAPRLVKDLSEANATVSPAEKK